MCFTLSLLNEWSIYQMAIAAIARRRKLLNDDVIVALAESSWEILDLSDSEVSDVGLSKVIEICSNVRAVDIRYKCEIMLLV